MLKRFLNNTSGNVGVIFALAALPIIVGSTLAIDKHNSNTFRADLQAATDNAVLSTVSNGSLKPGDRQGYAEARFHSNFPDIPAQLKFSDSNSIVSMTATAQMPTTLGGLVGRDTFTISATAAGTVNRGRTVCTLALAPDGAERVTFEDSVYFTADNCSVQVNSNDANAIVNTSTMVPIAKEFCVTGGGKGNFQPKLNSECAPVPDPYASLNMPDPGPCIKMDDFQLVHVLPGAEPNPDDEPYDGIIPTITSSLPTLTIVDPLASVESWELWSGSSRNIEPGNYCDGLTIDGVNVVFSPGVYHFGKEIKFKNGAQAFASNVTFVVYGYKGKIKVESGSEVYMKASSTGAMAGLAIVQDEFLMRPEDSKDAALVRVLEPVRIYKKKGGFKVPKSQLKSGGRLDVIGPVYLPGQSLEVSGTSVFGARSRSTSFIAYEVHFKENTRANIGVDHQIEGLPPVQPRSEESPRLIR
ncbi:TadE/TadG family type IV pilus assembly protein [Robiginitomaculum antarcticum]|uniref:TadE/TadG family type IV pilus assembly protein n=1 Tax=Robiginitomaculum antarcticum TaxID=437507 RepID=UPI0003807D59|nr:TadE/TadG family type IV pilus assembly protein [Robiginitomaculum antarcticum]